MKKWSFACIFAICAALFSSLFIPSQKPKKKRTAAPVEYTLETWKGFEEYKRLAMLLKGFAVESLIDIPCCDIHELKQHHLGIKRYIGVVSSKEEACGLQAQFGNDLRKFINLEIAIDALPGVDLILCWDKLCTMPQDQAQAALLQFKKSGAKYLLMHHYPSEKRNHKNRQGIFKPVNWKLPPYSFPEPIIQIMENGECKTGSLALWSFDNL